MAQAYPNPASVEVDNIITYFFNSVCEYMQGWNSIDAANNFNIDEVFPEPYAKFKKLVKLFSRALEPLYNDWFHDFFVQCAYDHKTIDTLFNAHCFTVNTKTRNVFLCFLYLCSFTYSLLRHCENNGANGLLKNLRLYLENALKTIYPRFADAGRWEELLKFCNMEILPSVIKFISNCYCEKAIFNTFVALPEGGYFCLGIHSRSTIDLFMNNVNTFELQVRRVFESEINANGHYRQAVDLAFFQLRSDLQRAPFETCLSRDGAMIKVDPTSPMSRI